MSSLTSASQIPPGPGGGKPPRHCAIIIDAFSPDDCERLNAAFAVLDAQEGGLVAGRFDTKVRQSSLVWLPEGEEFDWVAQRLARLVGDANRDTFRFALDGFEEQVQLASLWTGSLLQLAYRSWPWRCCRTAQANAFRATDGSDPLCGRGT
jgi:hypothetical protein